MPIPKVLPLSICGLGTLLASMLIGHVVDARGWAGPGADDLPQRVTMSYLKALAELDQDAMNGFLADRVTMGYADGEERVLDPQAAKNMRAFERGMKTRWSYRLKSVAGERVMVELTEGNEFYDLLGVGKRTQLETYFVRRGRIYRMQTTHVSHASGDFSTAYATFKTWLSQTPAATDARLTQDHAATMIFDGESATAMRPWLQRWVAERGKQKH